MNLSLYLSALVPLVAIDGIWITLMWKSFYQKQLLSLASSSPSYVPAIIFYLFYAAAIIFFVSRPAIRNSSTLLAVFLTGAFLGFIVYCAYDLTNQASLRDWPLIVTLVDMAWGTILTGLVSLISVWISRIGN